MAITQDYVDWATGNDYKGATFVDGAFTVADMTLTKTGAFAASKANHWLYLDDNGSGEVTTGYYRIASVTSNDAVVLAASPKSGANDPTDVKCTQHAGTTALPWRSDQGAVDLCTRNTTDGNQVNIVAGAAVVHTVALDLTTYIAGGTPSVTAPLIVRGCTSAANDGGIGEIDCGGATMFAAATYDDVTLVDLEIHTFGNNHGITLDLDAVVFRCEIHKGASSPSGKNLLMFGNRSSVIGCYVHDAGDGASIAIDMSGYGIVYGNYVVLGAGATGIGINSDVNGMVFIVSNVVTCSVAGQTGITVANYSGAVGNVLYNSTAGTAYGIYQLIVSPFEPIMNNIVVGWSGAGGNGIGTANPKLLGYNAFYNNTSNVTNTDQVFIDLTANDVALAADPFTDAVNGDFSLTAAAKTALAAKGWPTAYLGAHANTVPNLNIGPIQMAASTGGGVNMPRVRVGH